MLWRHGRQSPGLGTDGAWQPRGWALLSACRGLSKPTKRCSPTLGKQPDSHGGSLRGPKWSSNIWAPHLILKPTEPEGHHKGLRMLCCSDHAVPDILDHPGRAWGPPEQHLAMLQSPTDAGNPTCRYILSPVLTPGPFHREVFKGKHISASSSPKTLLSHSLTRVPLLQSPLEKGDLVPEQSRGTSKSCSQLINCLVNIFTTQTLS